MDEKILEERVLEEVNGGSGEPLDTTVDVHEWPGYEFIGRFEVSSEWYVMSLKYLISQKINLHVNNFRLFNRDHTQEVVYNSPISTLSPFSHHVVVVDRSGEIVSVPVSAVKYI